MKFIIILILCVSYKFSEINLQNIMSYILHDIFLYLVGQNLRLSCNVQSCVTCIVVWWIWKRRKNDIVYNTHSTIFMKENLGI